MEYAGAALQIGGTARQIYNAYSGAKRRRTAQAGRSRAVISSDEHQDSNKQANSSFLDIVMSSRKLKGAGRYTFLYQNQSTLNVSEGQQNAADMAYHGTLNQLYSPASTINTVVAADAWRDSAFSMNPYDYYTGSKLWPAATAPPSGDYCIMSSCMASMQVSNFSTLGMEIDVIWCRCVASTQYSPVGWWTQVLLNRQLQGETAATNPATIAGGMSAGTPLITTYGQKPQYDNTTFGKYWKIVHKRTIIIQGASTHNFKYKVHFNRKLDKINLQYLAGVTPVQNYIKGVTLVPMIIGRPTPVISREGSNVFSGDKSVTTGQGRIGWVYTHRYVFHAVHDTQPVIANLAAPQFVSAAAIGTTNFEAMASIIDTTVNPVQA